jgi:hypothetical protein
VSYLHTFTPHLVLERLWKARKPKNAGINCVSSQLSSKTPVKLFALAQQINQLLEEREERTKQKRSEVLAATKPPVSKDE